MAAVQCHYSLLLLRALVTHRFRHTAEPGDEITNIIIFGCTGMTGGSVLDATLGCAWFKVSGFTRANHGVVYEELVSRGVNVFTGDMNKPHTLAPAMKDTDTVFLVTTFWESMNVEREYMQGVNVVNVALESAVKHLIYVGTDYSTLTAKQKCNYLEGKAKIENYIVSVGIPYTLVHLGFYFENFVSVFKPHPTGKDKFAIALPMGDIALNCGSVIDFGQCISKVALRPHSYVFKTIKLSTSYLTVEEIANKFSRHFITRTFYDPKISWEEYQQFKFDGAQEIATMFAHYQTVPEWDRTFVEDLIPSTRTFEQWLKDNEKMLLDVLSELQAKEYKTPPSKLRAAIIEEKSWDLKALFQQGFSALGMTVKSAERYSELSPKSVYHHFLLFAKFWVDPFTLVAATRRIYAPMALSLASQEVRRHAVRCRMLNQLRYDQDDVDA